MTKWTEEQLQAINEEGKNIIVSAGAGSGKTAVLTERVIRKLKEGIKINELLILTFTNAAASEMKDRIRREISKYPELKENLDYLDSAYITTFDAYTLSLVKKYSYILNVSPNLSIVDNSVISIVKSDIIEEVFNEFYENNDPKFTKFVSNFTVKNDTNIKEFILDIIKKVELKSDLMGFLDTYLVSYLSDYKIDEYIDEYNNLLHKEIDNIETNLMYLEDSDYSKFYEDMVSALEKLIKSKDYDEIKRNVYVKLPNLPRNSEDIKPFKESISESLDNLKEYLRFTDTLEIKEIFTSIKDYIIVIIDIIKKYYLKIKNYKETIDLYEFSDIAHMAIKLLKENYDIKEELKMSYQEILVDEYQDTNDLQEEFINLIENDNVYMVGDIKQSIYGFRNANPSIFKEKYNRYKDNLGGIKIDLLKNFRSRKEVLEGINNIFNLIMDEVLGGANYQNGHQMIFGNDAYEIEKDNSNYDLEILNYDKKDINEKEIEIEAFIVGNDIKNKINKHFQVVDKDTKKLRCVRYTDFCLIMDRGTNFPVIKKIFEYLEIPLNIWEDKKLTSETDILLINNLMGLILKVYHNQIDTEFKYYFMSIARSYLFSYSDDYIFEIIKNNSYKDTKIYEICLDITRYLDVLDNYTFLDLIIDKFNFYENTIKVGNIEESIIRINNLFDIASNLNTMGYTKEMFKEYLAKMIEGKDEIKYNASSTNDESVLLMNIHKSKGLEFPICYYLGLSKKFNDKDKKERFTFDNAYGFITPYFKEGIGSTILKDLFIQKYNMDNIGERIRLFYVALTRAKEKMIIVASLNDNVTSVANLVDNNIRSKYNSFLDILNSINGNLKPYIKNVDLSNLNITQDYLSTSGKRSNVEGKEVDQIKYINLEIPNEIMEDSHASKVVSSLITKREYELLQSGTKAHEYFEQTDFMHIKEDNPYKTQIEYLKDKLNITENSLLYKEHEFVFTDEDTLYHGIIDLVVVEEDTIKIVDYKLKNVDDEKYLEQLNIYSKYLKTISDKKIKLYLYSIVNNTLQEIL